MYDFLRRATKLGNVSIFTRNTQQYADPILNKLDPGAKFFKNRFYGDSCFDDRHGQRIKDMSVIQTLIDEQRP